MLYYLIREGANLMAIHRVGDSAAACFERLVREGKGERYLELIAYQTDDFGCRQIERLLYTWSRSTGIIVSHMNQEVASPKRAPPPPPSGPPCAPPTGPPIGLPKPPPIRIPQNASPTHL